MSDGGLGSRAIRREIFKSRERIVMKIERTWAGGLPARTRARRTSRALCDEMRDEWRPTRSVRGTSGRSGSRDAGDPEANFAAAAFVDNGRRACSELI
jgi:hypothetical protein